MDQKWQIWGITFFSLNKATASTTQFNLQLQKNLFRPTLFVIKLYFLQGESQWASGCPVQYFINK